MKLVYIHALVLGVVVAAVAGIARGMGIEQIRTDVTVLAHDSLAGRGVGEIGEEKAARYLEERMKAIGLRPMGVQGTYRHHFDFIKEITISPKTALSLNGTPLQIHTEFEPFRQSANGEFHLTDIVFVGYGIKVRPEDGSYNDYEGLDVTGKGVVINRFSPDPASNPHVPFDKYAAMTDKIATAIELGARAIFFITPPEKDDTLPRMGAVRVSPRDVPVIHLRRAALERLGIELSKPIIASLAGTVELVRTRDTGVNVVGYLPGRSDTTVVIGAHYDHLGWGHEGSLYAGKEPQIHNGADDNASGTAGLLALASWLTERGTHNKYSYLFTAFSGEESGLLGSNQLVKEMPVDLAKIRMMINMDMIGRLSTNDTGLAIFGIGTAAEFKRFFDGYKRDDLTLAFREPGTGPSDHTAFYNKQIPVLHFFTGAHADYHKPTDDVERVDFEGIVKVLSVIGEVLSHFDSVPGPLAFQKTVDPMSGRMSSGFSVTLGIMPDYVAEVEGLRVDGVSANRPAERAGVIGGDIIVKLGTVVIKDINDYMSALGKFRKNDSTEVWVVRGTDTLSLPVVFR